jgi:hypothetical protein
LLRDATMELDGLIAVDGRRRDRCSAAEAITHLLSTHSGDFGGSCF